MTCTRIQISVALPVALEGCRKCKGYDHSTSRGFLGSVTVVLSQWCWWHDCSRLSNWKRGWLFQIVQLKKGKRQVLTTHVPGTIWVYMSHAFCNMRPLSYLSCDAISEKCGLRDTVHGLSHSNYKFFWCSSLPLSFAKCLCHAILFWRCCVHFLLVPFKGLVLNFIFCVRALQVKVVTMTG